MVHRCLTWLFLSLFAYPLCAQVFQSLPQAFYNVGYSSVEWADYNKDGYPDVLLVGIDGSDVPHTAVFKNNGNGTFTAQTFGLQTMYLGSVSWGDFNNDTYPDILMCGYTGSVNFMKIYTNNAGTSFTELPVTFPGLHVSSVACGDYNKDGFLDFIALGWTGSAPFTKIYKNNGNGTFTAQDAISIINLLDGTVAWGDYDNDADLDLLICGYTVNAGNGSPAAKIYKNNGNGTFTETAIQIAGISGNAGGRNAAWGDYDKDGKLDFVIAGHDNSGNRFTKIYKNNGSDSFTEQTGIVLPAVDQVGLAWGDYNNDGYLDLLVSGLTNTVCVTKLFKNNGNGTFSDVTAGEPFTDVWMGAAAWADYDKNGRLDLFLTGQNALSGAGGRIGKIYKNMLPSSAENVFRAINFELYQNFPNPFNPSTTISFDVPERSDVVLAVYTMMGEKMATLASTTYDAGTHSVEWNAAGLPSGIYFYELKAGAFRSVRKLSLVK